MAYHSGNRLLMDVFEKCLLVLLRLLRHCVGPHRGEFSRQGDRPFLGNPYGETLEKGELVLQYGEDGLSIRYYETVYPLSIKSYATLIDHRFDELRDRLGEESLDFVRVLGIETVLERIPADHVVIPRATRRCCSQKTRSGTSIREAPSFARLSTATSKRSTAMSTSCTPFFPSSRSTHLLAGCVERD